MGSAATELMRQLLQVEPDAPTPFLLLNDIDGPMRLVIDTSLMRAAQLNLRPLVNTESTGVAPQALLNFIASCSRAPLIVDFAAMALANAEAATAASD